MGALKRLVVRWGTTALAIAAVTTFLVFAFSAGNTDSSSGEKMVIAAASDSEVPGSYESKLYENGSSKTENGSYENGSDENGSSNGSKEDKIDSIPEEPEEAIPAEYKGEDGRMKCADVKDLEFHVAGKTDLDADEFIKREGDKFTIGCKEFIFAGWNQWEILELASDAPAPFRYTPSCGRQHIVNVMNKATETGLKVMRAWAHTITEGHEMQTAPGEYNEAIFQAMDFVNDEARKRGIRIIWALVDNWYEIGGVDSYVKWSKTAEEHEDFFTDEEAIQLYKDNFAAIANRKNSINGLVYKEDPTIMAWNLANEARCQGCGNEPMQKWLEAMCDYVKEEDPNHLVGIGYEGFYGLDSGLEEGNPGLGGSDWAAREGQNFVENSKIPCIDYVGFHVWPDNWNFLTTEFQQKFIKEHIDQGAELNKPVIMEEFGKIWEDNVTYSVRNDYFQSAYEIAEAKALDNGPLKGTLFWHWYDEGVGPGKYGVRVSHKETWQIIENHTDFMNELFEEAPEVCDAEGNPLPDPEIESGVDLKFPEDEEESKEKKEPKEDKKTEEPDSEPEEEKTEENGDKEDPIPQ